jgi:spore coat polysaccharide biosynthesis protein SpsF
MSVEVMTFAALEKSWREARLKSEREHVTPYIWQNSTVKGKKIFKALAVQYSPDLSHIRLTIDHPEDLEVLQSVVDLLGPDASLSDYVKAIQDRPQLAQKNEKFKRFDGYKKSIRDEN